MSRPGFVFDLALHDTAHPPEFTCRGCGVTERGGGVSSAELHASMRIHVRERHALPNADEWKLTHHDRNAEQRIVCFWPPEAV